MRNLVMMVALCCFVLPISALCADTQAGETIEVPVAQLQQMLNDRAQLERSRGVTRTTCEMNRFDVLAEVIRPLTDPTDRVQLSRCDYEKLQQELGQLRGGKEVLRSECSSVVVERSDPIVLRTGEAIDVSGTMREVSARSGGIWVDTYTTGGERQVIVRQPAVCQYRYLTRERLEVVRGPSVTIEKSPIVMRRDTIVVNREPVIVRQPIEIHQPVEIHETTIIRKEPVIIREPKIIHETKIVECDPVTVEKAPTRTEVTTETREVSPSKTVIIEPRAQSSQTLPSCESKTVIRESAPTTVITESVPTTVISEAAPTTIMVERPSNFRTRMIQSAAELGAWGHEAYQAAKQRFIHLSRREFKTAEDALAACYADWFPVYDLSARLVPEMLPKNGRDVFAKLGAMHAQCFATGSDFAAMTAYPSYPYHYVAYAESLNFYLRAEGLRTDTTETDIVIREE